MKPFNPKRNSGSVLLATMIFVLAIAAYMVYYLMLVQNSNQNVVRAQRWNAALPIAEAGIEEGMANLNLVSITTVSNASKFNDINKRSLNGGWYYVNSGAAGVVATITATGTVTAPITGDSISRTVRVTAQRQGLFSKGMISMTAIKMNGNGLILDSWNSHDTNQSLNGIWNGYRGTNGDIAAMDGLLNVGNQTIYGNLYLGPNSTYNIGAQGSITGTVYNDWNMPFPDVTLPTNDINNNPISWQVATTTNIPSGKTTIPVYIFTTGGYYIINDNSAIEVAPGVQVTLQVPSGNPYAPKGLTIDGGTTNSGTITMYQQSGSLSLSGSSAGGATNNRPENFVYFGLPGVTSISFSGNASFVGVIYAPEADFTQSGGGSSAIDFRGSIVVKSITVNGNFSLHYDDSLVGYYYGYYAAGFWQEL